MLSSRVSVTSCLFFAGLVAALAVAPDPAAAQETDKYEFLSASHTGQTRLYRVERATGEVTLCWWGDNGDAGPAVGRTDCATPGLGALAQMDGGGDYGLRRSSSHNEGGIFRVNGLTGGISICWYMGGDKKIVDCTPEGS